MNEMNSVETILRSWKPRQPSPRIKRRLFGVASIAAHFHRWQLGILAPTAICVLLTGIAWRQHTIPGSASFSPMEEALNISSNQSEPFGLQEHSRQNNLPSRFEWTNGGAFTSSVTSFLPAQLN